MSDIEKLSVFSPQIVQERPKYAVRKGPLSTTTQPFKSLSSSQSQMTFNVQVPSLNVFVDRELLWESELYLQMNVDSATPVVADDPIVVFGRNVAFASHPLHRLCSTQTATINDCVVSLNTQDVLDELVYLTNFRDNRPQKTTPCYMDTYKRYNDGVGAINSPINSFFDAVSNEDVPNGSYHDIIFTDPSGTPLTGDSFYDAPGGTRVNYKSGIPVGDDSTQQFPLFIRAKFTEKVMLSPFIFSEEHGDEVGLYGINNINMVFNLRTPENARIIRCASEGLYGSSNPTTLSSVTYNQNAPDPFGTPTIYSTFYTPSLEVALPPKSIVPYYNVSRYITNPNVQVPRATPVGPGTGQLVSQTITLPCIPDFIMVYAQPSITSNEVCDFYLPISRVSVNFDNFSGLLSSTPNSVLYRYAHECGLSNLSWSMWNGAAKVSQPGTTSSLLANNVPLRGAPLCLSFGRHVTLQSGLASGVVGNYTFQVDVTVNNTDSNEDVTPKLYILAFESGFCETSQGSTRLIRGPLTETDVISAPPADHTTFTQLERYVGGGLFSKLGTAMNKVKSMVAPILKDPKVRDMAKGFARQKGGKYGAMAADVADAFGMGVKAGAGRGRKAKLSALM